MAEKRRGEWANSPRRKSRSLISGGQSVLRQGGQPKTAAEKQKAAAEKHRRSRFSAPKAACPHTCRSTAHNPSLAVILTSRLTSRRTAFSGKIPMTGFRPVRPPPRLQWRYRSGVTPDSLFSSETHTASKALRWLFTFTVTITQFPAVVNQKSGINPLSAASASWVKPSRSLRYIQLSTESYSSSVIRRS